MSFPDEHYMVRGHCIGCVRLFGGAHPECDFEGLAAEFRRMEAVVDVARALVSMPWGTPSGDTIPSLVLLAEAVASVDPTTHTVPVKSL